MDRITEDVRDEEERLSTALKASQKPRTNGRLSTDSETDKRTDRTDAVDGNGNLLYSVINQGHGPQGPGDLVLAAA